RTLHTLHKEPEKRYLRSSQYCRNSEPSVAGLSTDTRKSYQPFYDTLSSNTYISEDGDASPVIDHSMRGSTTRETTSCTKLPSTPTSTMTIVVPRITGMSRDWMATRLRPPRP